MDFAYHRSIAPMMWVFFALAGVEIVVVHVLIALWRPWVALVVTLISLPVIVWLVRAIASFRRLPVRIADDMLAMRTGTIRSLSVPLANVAGLRTDFDGAAVKDRSVLNLALIAWPNVMVALIEPIAGRRGPIRSIAHRLDDPAAFVAALADRQRPPANSNANL